MPESCGSLGSRLELQPFEEVGQIDRDAEGQPAGGVILRQPQA